LLSEARLRVLFVAWSHLPHVGGAELTTDAIARELQRRRHQVAVLARQDPRRPPNREVDRSLGYLTLRSESPEDGLPAVLDWLAPDVVIVGGYHAETLDWTKRVLARATPLPTLLYLHDFAAAPLADDAELQIDRVAAVSRFVAELVEARGIDVACVPPIVERRRYRLRPSRRVALFINPVPQKGVDIAFALARARPDIPFAFTRCWYLAPAALRRLRGEARELGNVELRAAVKEPRRLYGDAKLLLVPSAYPEAWARVAPEAQMSGIPVLAAATGGLPDAVGEGGILITPEAGVDHWSRELARLWDDDSAYRRYVTLAERASRRSDVAPEAVGYRFESLLQEVAGARTSRRRQMAPPRGPPRIAS
jgi:glycosyltransferase involved in cell wall biosynthesis